jgi:hypothetical protein
VISTALVLRAIADSLLTELLIPLFIFNVEEIDALLALAAQLVGCGSLS